MIEVLRLSEATSDFLRNLAKVLGNVQRLYDFIWEVTDAEFSAWCSPLRTRFWDFFLNLSLELMWAVSTHHLFENTDLQFEFTLVTFLWFTCMPVHITLQRLGNYNPVCLWNASLNSVPVCFMDLCFVVLSSAQFLQIVAILLPLLLQNWNSVVLNRKYLGGHRRKVSTFPIFVCIVSYKYEL